jgi:N6-adenosine-specific RNA methylase IME4
MFETLNPPYQVIYADPPWSYRDRRQGHGGVRDHYHTMTTQELMALPVPQLAGQNALLFLWATFPNLPVALDVLNAWQFVYKTQAFTWIKQYPLATSTLVLGLGSYTRSNAEVCLLGLKGKKWTLARNVSSVVIAPRERHSKKPDAVRNRIVRLCGDVPRVELFARDRVPGWDAWGEDVHGDE